MNTKVTIFLADDHSILREGLKLILGSEPRFEVTGEAGDGREAMEGIEQLKPDVAIIDISMPVMNGIEITAKLRKYVPETRIIILSRHDNEEYVKQLLQYGVKGYVLKDDAGDDLLRATDEVMKGNIFLSPKITSCLVSGFLKAGTGEALSAKATAFNVLSSREREILKLIAEGLSNREIAGILRISHQTVKTHRANIMKKLGLHKTADLVTYAVKNGFVEV